jgi:hypothetical protein
MNDFDDDDDENNDGYMVRSSSQKQQQMQQQQQSAWEARRRRKANTVGGGKGTGGGVGENSGTARNRSQSRSGRGNSPRNKKKESLPDDEYDPYDSDPGESYREHCERIKGESTKTCLAMPRFLKQLNGQVGPNNVLENGNKTVATSPPSPLQSELDEGSPMMSRNGGVGLPPGTTLFGGVDAGSLPASLPRDLARVRYSLRTSIGDGSQPQPATTSSTLMERRELRPNNIHINVSHWSDFGGRNYMEDRYVYFC